MAGGPEKGYVFLDEVQRVPEYEKLVDGLSARKNADIYITGSNAYVLSGDLGTFLTGRYVEYQLHPLSFAEFHDGAAAPAGLAERFHDYLRSMSSIPS